MMTDLASLLIDTLTLGPTRADDRSRLWAGPDLRAIERLIRVEGAGAWLYRRWREAGTGPAVAAPLHQAIRTTALAELGVALHVESAAAEALEILTRAGFELVLLKGLAYRAAAPSYPYLDARSTSDMDILVAPGEGEHAWQALRDAAFVPIPHPLLPTPREHHHLEGLHSSRGVTIELHTSTSPTRPPEEAWMRLRGSAVRTRWNGMSVFVPSATEMLWHAVEHSLTHGAEGFRLRQFLPAAALLAARAPVDVDQIQHRVTAERLRESHENRLVSSAAIGQWLAMASALAGDDALPLPWSGGNETLWRLLSWRLSLLQRLPIESRLQPYLLEQGTRAEVGLSPRYSTSHRLFGNRARYRAMATLSRLAYGILKPSRKATARAVAPRSLARAIGNL